MVWCTYQLFPDMHGPDGLVYILAVPDMYGLDGLVYILAVPDMYGPDGLVFILAVPDMYGPDGLVYILAVPPPCQSIWLICQSSLPQCCQFPCHPCQYLGVCSVHLSSLFQGWCCWLLSAVFLVACFAWISRQWLCQRSRVCYLVYWQPSNRNFPSISTIGNFSCWFL